MKKVKAKKSLGQHFLTDPAIADRIAESIEPFKHLPVVEVGPGMGILTMRLIERGFNLYVVEIDPESIEYLQNTLPKEFVNEGRIIHNNILRVKPEEIIPGQPDTPFVMIGNYPYNISGRLFFNVFEMSHRIVCCAGMLQKEVAYRITSPPGSRQYGILSVLLRSRYDAEYLFTVDKSEFSPPPKVDGGVLRLVRNERTALPCNEQLFIKVVKTAFGQRRKTLRNALKTLFGPEYPYQMLSPETQHLFTLRAERLDVDDFVTLTQALEQYGNVSMENDSSAEPTTLHEKDLME